MRRITKHNFVSVCECQDKYDKETENNFDSGLGYYKNIIKPMLAAGHEGELILWLKRIVLLKSSQKCINSVNNNFCEEVMHWVPKRIIDQYQWKCICCKKDFTTREDSIFQRVRCHLKDAIRILAGWCKGSDVDTVSKFLNIKSYAVYPIYNIAETIASKYMKLHLEKWKVGGPNVIVLVESYPESFLEINSNLIDNFVTPILCLAEVKDIPPKYWFQELHCFNINSIEDVKNLNLMALEVVQEMVLPGSILVANLNSKVCSCHTLEQLKHVYPTIISKEELQRHDNPYQILKNNLEVIWNRGVYFCVEAQYNMPPFAENFLVSNLWRQQFQEEAFEMLLKEMCYNFV